MKFKKILPIIILLVIVTISLVSFSRTRAANSIAVSVNAANVLQTGVRDGARLGINTDYWWDDQANRTSGAASLSSALDDMGAKYWRYPGGEKADGYLWSLPPFTASNPKLARTDTSTNGDWPANDADYWIGNTQSGGSFTHPIYDFDEFMADCQAADCIPIIVVAYDGIYKAATGNGQSLTRQQALDTSAAWVNYANNVKGYDIKYWEIGNETYFNGAGDGHDYMGVDPGRTTQATDFIEFCDNMKAQDSTILCGVNTESEADFGTLLSIAHSDIGFFDVHGYEAWPYVDYDDYANDTLNQNVKVDYAWNALQDYPADMNRIEIIVAETGGITFGFNGDWDAADTGHALMNFETMAMLMQDERVTATTFWNTHWMEQLKNNTWPNYIGSEYDALKPDNSLSPQGWAIKLLADYALDQMVGTTSSGKVRVYATTNAAGRMNIWLVNKDTVASDATVALQNYSGAASGDVSVYKGNSSADMYPVFTPNDGTVAVNGNEIDITLDPVSITIIELESALPAATATSTAVLPTSTTVPTATNTSVPTTSTTVPTATNTPSGGNNELSNPGFETGSASPWGFSTGASVVGNNVHSGAYATQITGSSNGIWYSVSGLNANTMYTFSAWLKADSAGDSAYLYAKNFDASGAGVVSSNFNGTAYTEVTITFTTDANNTTAEVGLWRDAGFGTGDIFADDFVLSDGISVPTSTPTIVPTSTSLPPTATPTTQPNSTPTTVPTGCNGTTNIALNKNVVSTSSVQSGKVGQYGVDGSSSTRWQAKRKSTLATEYIVIDLGSSMTFCEVQLYQGDRYATAWNIQVSNDNANWSVAHSSTNSVANGWQTATFSNAAGRYVKFETTAWNRTQNRIKLYEFQLFQP